jgi:hypothetical protein
MTGSRLQPVGKHTVRSDSIPLMTKLSSSPGARQTDVLHKREKIAQLLRLFSSARKRLGLTPDEILIFCAIGHLSASISKDLIVMSPISYTDVALLLGIPKETVRRKTIRLMDIEYVGCTSKGIFVKQLETWCQMFVHLI